MLQGAIEVILTNLDVLGYLPKIPVCSAYELKGQRTNGFPVSALLDQIKPVIEFLPGWLSDISAIRQFKELPLQAQSYVSFVEKQIAVRVSCVTVGPKREQMIWSQ